MTRSLASVRLVAVTLSLVAAACTGSPPSPIPSSAPSFTPKTATPVPLVTATTVAPEPTATVDPSGPATGDPPAATMAAEGGDPVTGALGSFTWGDGGSDSPWLPGAAIAVGKGESLTVTLADETPAAEWLVKRVPAGTVDGVGAVSLGHGDGTPIMFAAPSPGEWSVQVDVTFGNDLGAATYYWGVTVR